MTVEKMRKGKESLKEKGRDTNYAERRWMLQLQISLFRKGL